jgi:predicted peroxiredoxin
VKSAWGSDDPTRAAFPFLHANALAEAGHHPQIFLLGEAVSSLMRDPVASAVVPGAGRRWRRPFGTIRRRRTERSSPLFVS